jgi:uncharacterized protein
MTIKPLQSSKSAPEMLDILRCPVGVKMKDKGTDPGRLRLVKGVWLVCDDSGYKYPIINGIPRMMEEIGQKYKATPEDQLPVPPPDEK